MLQPSSAAIPLSFVTAAFLASSFRSFTRKAIVGIAPRLPGGMPSLYLPVSSPLASGLQVVSPRPMFL